MNTVTKDHFTIEEADALLPDIIPIVSECRRLKREVESIAAGCNYDICKLDKQKADMRQRTAKLGDLLDQLEEMGVYVKDLDIGLLDFPSTFEKRDVMLCWKLGERGVSHWHEMDEGFAWRREIIILDDNTPLTTEYEVQ